MTDRLFNTLVHAAKQALQHRDLEEAERLVGKLLASYPTQAASHGLELERLLASGQMDEAGKLAEHLVARFPSSAGILFQAGMAASRQKKHDRALAHFEESEKLYSSRKTRRWIGKTLTNLGRFDDAESLLINLHAEDPYCGIDLAWLYERKGDATRAMTYVEKHLDRYPNDRRALSQRIRLRGDEIDTDDLLEQMDALEALGEPIPEELISKYVSALVADGQSDHARQFARDQANRMSQQTLVSLAWACHRLQMHDIAFELFVLVLENRLDDFKLLNTLEFSAKRAGRVEELAAVYETLGPKQPKLYGRAKRLKPQEDV